MDVDAVPSLGSREDEVHVHVGQAVPAGPMENGAFHGEAIDSDLIYPVTPDAIFDEELDLQRNMVLDALQASCVHLDEDLAEVAEANPGAEDAEVQRSSRLLESDIASGGVWSVWLDIPSVSPAESRELVDPKPGDDSLVKKESREIEQLSNQESEARDVSDINLKEHSSAAEPPQARTTNAAVMFDADCSNLKIGDEALKPPSWGSLAGTSSAGAEGTLAAEPALSSLSAIGPSVEEGRRIIHILENAGIIPEVLDQFIPTTKMEIFYKTAAALANGSRLTSEEVATQPEIVIDGALVKPDNTYAVVLVDSDAKRDVDGERAERLLWLQIGIPVPRDVGATTGVIARGTNLVEYEAPKAKDDRKHRYLYVLFRHENEKFKVPADREAFSCRLFAALHDVTPIAATYFTVKNTRRWGEIPNMQPTQ